MRCFHGLQPRTKAGSLEFEFTCIDTGQEPESGNRQVPRHLGEIVDFSFLPLLTAFLEGCIIGGWGVNGGIFMAGGRGGG